MIDDNNFTVSDSNLSSVAYQTLYGYDDGSIEVNFTNNNSSDGVIDYFIYYSGKDNMIFKDGNNTTFKSLFKIIDGTTQDPIITTSD